MLETPLRDLSGDIIYEENNRGQLVPARRFSPEYWRDKFEAYRLMKEVKQPASSRIPVPAGPEAVRITGENGQSVTCPINWQFLKS